MKPEEAIRILEVAKAECEWNAPLEYQGAFDAAIEALEKQVPIDPLDRELGSSPRRPIIIPCGNCSMDLSYHMWEYCPHCGQKILWT